MKKNVLLIFVFVFSLFSIGAAQDNSFEKSLKKFKNRYTLGQFVSSDAGIPVRDGEDNLIDSTYLTTYKLFNPDFIKGKDHLKDVRIKHLKGYQCEHVGHYKTKNGFLLFSTSKQTATENGNPLISLTTIAPSGKLIDQVTFSWDFIQDEGFDEAMNFSISKDWKIRHEQMKTEYKIEDGKRLPLKTTRFSTKYTLSEDGHFKQDD